MRRLIKRFLHWVLQVEESKVQEDMERYHRHGRWGKEFRIVSAVNGYVVEFAQHDDSSINTISGHRIPMATYVVGREENMADALTAILVERKLMK